MSDAGLCRVLHAVLRRQRDLLGGLVFGWVGFLGRTLPAISINWDLIGMVAICFTILFVRIQYLVSWEMAQIREKDPSLPKWR